MLKEFDGHKPEIHSSAFISNNSLIIGRVSIGERASVWPGCVLRADVEDILIGENTNIQDGVLAHPDISLPVIIGKGVTVGHGAVIHGCRIGSNCLIGMGAVILSGAVIEDNCIIGAAALVTENMKVHEGSLLLGVPGKVTRKITKEELGRIYRSAEEYLKLAEVHAKSQRD
jgi:carbonic anhydrase/acetyltransferase-like protein (isoleucine patch superfamily)